MDIRKINNTKEPLKIRQVDFDEDETQLIIKNKNYDDKNSADDKTNEDFILKKLEMMMKTNEVNVNDDKNSSMNDKTEPNIHKNHRMRLKNQFLQNGLSSLTDVQKLELLLFFSIPQKDTNPIAHKLLEKFGSLKNVFSASQKTLTEVKGIKENSAILIKLISSFFKELSTPNDVHSINGVSDAKNFCKQLYVGVDVEQFYVICLSKSNQIINYKMLQSGSADEVVLQIRKITEFAIDNNCSRIIVSHNHPSGHAVMSDEDAAFTYNLICSCLLNSIEIIDHIIVGTDTVISLAYQKHLTILKEKAYNLLEIPASKQALLSSGSAEYVVDED